MEQVLNALKEEIKKVSSQDKIDSGKLTELLAIYRKVESYTITSVSQVQPIRELNPDGYGAFPALPPARNETVTMYDQIIKAAQDMYKAQTPDVASNQIMRYIEWYKFLDMKLSIHVFDNTGKEIITDENLITKANDIQLKIYERIINDIEKELNKKDKKDEIKDKLYDHIVDDVKKEVEKNKEIQEETQ